MDTEHEFRVCQRVMDLYLDDEDVVELMVIAVAHDWVEDGYTTLDKLRELGYTERVVAAIDAISRRDGEVYADYIQRVKLNEDARRVKIADLQDNLSRGEKGELRKRYEKALKELS